MKCPICVKNMEHKPDDDIAQWQCPCGKLFTEGFMKNMTVEKAEKMQAESVSKRIFNKKREGEMIKQIADDIGEKKKQKTQQMFNNFTEDDDNDKG